MTPTARSSTTIKLSEAKNLVKPDVQVDDPGRHRAWVEHKPGYDITIKAPVAKFARGSKEELKKAKQVYATKTLMTLIDFCFCKNK